MKLILFLATVSAVLCQELYKSYNLSFIELTGAGLCPSTHEIREKIFQDVDLFINNSILPRLFSEHGSCHCGGPEWRKVVYLNMSDPTQTCPPAWELITTPRRSCARPSNASSRTCYSATFPMQDIHYSQVCGRIIGYQVGEPQAFLVYNVFFSSIDNVYVDGVSLTYGNPRQHIWTFANALDERLGHLDDSKCLCTNINNTHIVNIPPYIGNDYFCETGVPTGQAFDKTTFHADDPLWDGQGCGPTSTCCTFNNPPWFCKQLPQSTNADLEIRLCSYGPASVENTPIELVEIYTN